MAAAWPLGSLTLGSSPEGHPCPILYVPSRVICDSRTWPWVALPCLPTRQLWVSPSLHQTAVGLSFSLTRQQLQLPSPEYLCCGPAGGHPRGGRNCQVHSHPLEMLPRC